MSYREIYEDNGMHGLRTKMWNYTEQKHYFSIDVPAMYDEIININCGFHYKVKLHSKYGIINDFGKIVVPIIYDEICYLDPHFGCKLNGKYHIISQWDIYNRIARYSKLTFSEYEDLGKYDQSGYCRSYQLLPVKLKGKWGYINGDGEDIISVKYDEADNFHDEHAKVKLDGVFGFIDRKGKTVIPFMYENATPFQNVFTNQKWDGSSFICLPYGILKYPVKEQIDKPILLAKVKTKGKFGYIDITNNARIDFKYDEADDFFNGFARVKNNDKYGFINYSGKEIIPLQYANAFEMSCGGYFAVCKDNKWICLNEIGLEEYPPEKVSFSLKSYGIELPHIENIEKINNDLIINKIKTLNLIITSINCAEHKIQKYIKITIDNPHKAGHWTDTENHPQYLYDKKGKLFKVIIDIEYEDDWPSYSITKEKSYNIDYDNDNSIRQIGNFIFEKGYLKSSNVLDFINFIFLY